MFKKLKATTSSLATNVKDKVDNVKDKVTDKEKITYVVQPLDSNHIKGGFVVAIGSNQENQMALGAKPVVQLKTPTGLPCSYPLNVAYVAAGADHIYFVSKDGKLYYTGSNKFGQLGSMNASSADSALQNTNTKVSKAKHVFAGAYHTTFLSDKGELLISGKGDLNGTSSDENKYTPNPVPALSNKKVTLYATGNRHSVAVDELGNLFAWGRGDLLGIGSFIVVKKITTFKYEPVSVDCATFLTYKIKQIACGDEHTVALLQNGSIFAWGRGEDGQLGHGVKETRHSPIHIDSLQPYKITSISCGMNSSAAITTDNDCYVWGHYFAPKMTPELLSSSGTPIRNVQQISQSGYYNIVLAEQNDIYTFGADYKVATEAMWNPTKLKFDDPFILTKKVTQVVASQSNYYLIVYEGSAIDNKVQGLDYGQALSKKDMKSAPAVEMSQQQKNLNSLLGARAKPTTRASSTSTTSTTSTASTKVDLSDIGNRIANIEIDHDSDNDEEDDEDVL
ncbi:hypothetical protein SAMD00019534_054880 [Acytostelium subglobosum LB1]|uniref:hypothetical protein n=1 Tax=Acytostelium subglobosum LB1 TaxID=1410327 RepID=UPI000644E978|nr:hypothetical protein SAMD00019534_054880 [Acytostelium subglobosum LB1]GAM22313.1 hypothetical protein SAMD00019534_054880 [Acytostelium subglobosum LB1]|eukprot:XP_012754433.1 hypothetical protein SAMD00019534_054880 [Acytostelium subglobosum LB1]